MLPSCRSVSSFYGSVALAAEIGNAADMPLFAIKSALCIAGAILWAGASAAQAPPVPPPVPQLQVDCGRPQYASDSLICSDSSLLSMDAEVAARAAAAAPGLSDGAIWETHAAWFRRRSLCAFNADHRGCLEAAYSDRRASVDALLADLPPTISLRCNGAWTGRQVQASTAGKGMPLVFADAQGLLGVATSVTANSLWQPYLSARPGQRTIQLESLASGPISCRIKSASVPN